jgi:uncharacterized RDD family membrane protein YckC
MQYVGFWVRVAASLVDTIALVAITSLLGYAVFGTAYDSGLSGGWGDLLISLVLPAALVIGLWSRLQSTPGKMIFKARIVDADTGAEPGAGQWLLRYAGYFVSTLGLCIGFFWIGIDPRKQGWHDKMANTVVVRPIRG